MKKFNKILLIVLITVAFTSVDIFAQGPGPPPPPDHSSIGNQNKGGAPIGGGLFILLGLGAAYGGFKGYKFYKKKNKSMLD
ncbi:MAG: hypothetical protein IMY69_03095 [Bacteroidetes bacterium]|nr:hypothetical protein [Bacteroidota bacterium]MCK4408112.1 hypothetical protein [Bacteroidales bacterium]